MIKVLYDHQIFSSQKAGGISRYFCELLRKIALDIDFDIELSVIVSNNIYLKNYNVIRYIDFFPKKDFKGKVRLMDYINRIKSIKKIKSKRYDIFHPTYYSPYFLKYLNNRPFVLTVYDMIHEKFRYLFPSKDKTSFYKKELCMKASKIIAISKNTKKDLIEIFGIDESKIEVVYLGSSIKKENKKRLSFALPERYILFVGNRNGYKNFSNLVKAYSLLVKEYKEIELLCVGGGNFNAKELKTFKKLNIEKRVHHLWVMDEYLSTIYENALMFVFPSLYEGFGIPILEAFSCECPVVCSNTSSFPEIAKDAALYFEPTNVEDIYDTMVKLLSDNELKKILIKKGKERLKYFSWEKTVDKTKNIYRQVLE